MRLLNINTKKLEEYFDEDRPDYAILSHTWGKNEVTFQDIQKVNRHTKTISTKIDGCCEEARNLGLGYIWVDTCCIDKSSSAELSEAINSMFAWYRDAEVCFVYLADVPSASTTDMAASVGRSRWFTHGWTLQEYLAPENLRFYSATWIELFRYRQPVLGWNTIRGIELSDLTRLTRVSKKSWHKATLAEKLSWATSRSTTRKEDMAYCLLGLLGINMPLLYGEGNSAFRRLQEEVIKTSNSHDILLAGYNLPYHAWKPTCLASSLAEYRECGGHFQIWNVPGYSDTLHFSMTNAGLHIQLPLLEIDRASGLWLGLLDIVEFVVVADGGPGPMRHDLAIVLQKHPRARGAYTKISGMSPQRISSTWHRSFQRKTIYIADRPFDDFSPKVAFVFDYRQCSNENRNYSLHSIFPAIKLYERIGVLGIELEHRATDLLLAFDTSPRESQRVLLHVRLGWDDAGLNNSVQANIAVGGHQSALGAIIEANERHRLEPIFDLSRLENYFSWGTEIYVNPSSALMSHKLSVSIAPQDGRVTNPRVIRLEAQSVPATTQNN